MTMTQHAVLAIFWMTLGCCLGSFLNVCVYRIPRKLSLSRPRSRCPRCGAAILARHNVPVLGWLILGGRCRACRGPISPRYPAVELAVGVLFAAPYLLAVGLGGDPWERIGAVGLLGLLSGCWTLSALSVLAIGLGRESGWTFRGNREVGRHRAAGGCGVPASSALRS